MLFDLGRVVGTPAAIELLQQNGRTPAEYLDRHIQGDWGDMPKEDDIENMRSVFDGMRIMSAYPVYDRTGCSADPAECPADWGKSMVWVITEADRSATTLLLPEEY